MRAGGCQAIAIVAWVTACGGGRVEVVEPRVVVIEREPGVEVDVNVDVDVDLGVGGGGGGEIDVDDHHRDVVFILDASGSMRRSPERREPPVGIGAAPRPGIDLDVTEWFPSSEFGRAQNDRRGAAAELADRRPQKRDPRLVAEVQVIAPGSSLR